MMLMKFKNNQIQVLVVYKKIFYYLSIKLKYLYEIKKGS